MSCRRRALPTPPRWRSIQDAGIYFLSGTGLSEGDEVALRTSAGRDRLHLTLHGDEMAVVDSTASWTAREDAVDNGSGKTKGNAVGDFCGPCLLGEMDLARLNDGHFHLAHATAVSEALVARGVDIEISRSCRSQASTNNTSRQRPVASSATGVPVETEAAPPPPAFILDLCGAWGVAGLLVAQLERRDGTPATRVLAIAEGKEAAAKLNALAEENGLGPDRYLATSDELVEFISRGAVASRVGSISGGPTDALGKRVCLETVPGGSNNCWPGRDNGFEWAVVMGSSLVEGSGLLKQGGLGDLELCRQLIHDDAGAADASLRATFVPGHLEVICQGLQRASLLSENRVQHNSCCGVDVEPVNAFSVANFRELDLSAAARNEFNTRAGESGGVGTMQDNFGGREATTRAVNRCLNEGGEAFLTQEVVLAQEAFLTPPAVCYSLDLANVQAGPDGCLQRRSTRLHVRRDGTLHAIAYWYQQRLGPVAARPGYFAGILDTGPAPSPSAGDDWSSSHFRQAAVLLKEPIAVMAGQCIHLSVFCNTSKGIVVEVLGIADSVGA